MARGENLNPSLDISWYLEKVCPLCGYPLIRYTFKVAECAKCDFETDNLLIAEAASRFSNSVRNLY
jgi:uncharacterized Zn finger protein (UPF0148 family)